MEAALAALIDTVNATGGVVYNEEKDLVPAADLDWVDLASAYLLACRAMGVAPVGKAVTDVSRPLGKHQDPRRPRTRS